MNRQVTNAERKTELYPATGPPARSKKTLEFSALMPEERNARKATTDFLADMEGSLPQRIALIQDLEDLLGRKADVVTEEGLHRYIRKQVIKEAVPL